MKKKFLLLAAIISSGQLLAQEDTLVRSLDDVTVTATRFPKKVGETGKVVTIISKTDLERAGGKDLSQILNEQAGLVINGATSNPGKDKSVFLRGARTNYTLILINGVPVYDPSGVGGAFDLRMIPVEQIERIEILKGAQSTLYGSDAIAGVINIITKKGEGQKLSFYGGLSVGNYQTIKANAGLSGSTEGSTYNITFTHQETNGVPEAKDTTGSGNFPNNGFRQQAVSMDFDGRILPGLHLKPFFRYSHFKGTYSDGAFTPALNEFRSQLLTAGTQANYLFTKGSITGIFSYDEVSRTYNSSFGSSPFDGNKKTAEVFGNYSFGKYIQALAGYRFDRQVVLNPSPSLKDTSIDFSSPYLSVFLKNIGGFNFEAGGRYNHHSTYGSTFTYSLNPSVLVGKKWKLFFNYGTAFKAPGLAELFGQYGANLNLKPEESRTWEAGAQASLFRDILDIRVVYFDRKIKNVIVYDASFNYTNYDQQKDHGFEIEPALRFNDKLTIRMFYSFVDGEVTSRIAGKDSSYFNLIRRPKHSAGLNAGYQVTEQLFVSTNIRTLGRREDRFYNAATFQTEAKTLKAYTLWDAYAEYSFLKKKLKLFAQVNNVLDTDYDEVYGYTTLGTNFTAGFRFKL